MQSPNVDKTCQTTLNWITNTGVTCPKFLHSVLDLQVEISNDTWSFLTTLCKELSSLDASPETLARFGVVADLLIKAGNNKEMFFILLECCEVFQHPTYALYLIPKLCQVLLSLPYQQIEIDACFGTIYNHICCAHPIPSMYSFADNDGTEAVENDYLLKPLLEATDILLCFLEPFISLEMKQKENINHDALTCALFQILDYPLLYLRISGGHDATNACRRAVTMVATLHPTLFGDYLTDNVDFSSLKYTADDMIAEPGQFVAGDNSTRFTGLAHLLYLVFCHHMSLERVPKLYEAGYKFRLISPYLTQLFRRSSLNIVAEKATALASHLIETIPNNSLHADITEQDTFKGLFLFNFWSAQYCDISSVRKKCIQLVKQSLNKLQTDGRYYMLHWILHQKGKMAPEIMGFTCTLLKDEIYHSSAEIEAGSRTEGKLLQLLDAIYRPPDKGQSELIAELDLISAALNMARFLVKRCGDKRTKFSFHVEKLLENYVMPIGNVMRDYRERLLDELTHLQNAKKPLKDKPELSANAGRNRIEFSEEMETQATQAVMSKLDLVLYVHECLIESINNSAILNMNTGDRDSFST